MEEREKLIRAMKTLENYVYGLAEQAGESREYGERLWQGICRSPEHLQELAYYHDYGSFLGYTLADALVWQVDHFKLYMDRPEEMNRYRQPRLLLAAFDTMLQLETDPEPVREKMRRETGQDILG